MQSKLIDFKYDFFLIFKKYRNNHLEGITRRIKKNEVRSSKKSSNMFTFCFLCARFKRSLVPFDKKYSVSLHWLNVCFFKSIRLNESKKKNL